MLTDLRGTAYGGAVDASTLVLGSLVILAVADSASRGSRHAIIARDMLAGDDYRRLRVALKWGVMREPGGTQA